MTEITPKFLREEDKQELADEFGVELRALKAVLKVESSGSGFGKDGKVKIQFEPYHFRKYTDIRIDNGVEGQTVEYEAYFKAVEIDQKAAMLSTSWGLGQIMGFNHKAAGYSVVDNMVLSFNASEYYQLKGMLNFIKSNKKLYQALKDKDWATFARYYNGKYYKKFNYDTRLAAAYG